MNGVTRTTMVYLLNILTVYRVDPSLSESRGRNDGSSRQRLSHGRTELD